MFYYEVLVVQEYTARESVFTYASEKEVPTFSLVLVPMQSKTAAGLIVRKTTQPEFKTRPITQVMDLQFGKLQRQLVRFMKDYYGATEAQVLQLFMPAFLASLAKRELPHAVAPGVFPSNLPNLTDEQTAALADMRAKPLETVMLHGDTGSGKTRVYLERAREAVVDGKSVLIMTPEIALVPQLAKQFKACFGSIVHSYHSKTALPKKAAIWQQVAAGRQVVIIGTRSALFLPFQELGLIVVDEAHEPAYKQEEGVRYHASRVASVLAKLTGAQLMLGSATPLVSDMYLARQRGKPVVRMTASAITSDKTSSIELIDMKDQADFTAHPMLSNTLLNAIEAAIQRGEQSLVYLNRRGTARLILCSTCGWQAMCPNCDIALTYHHDAHELRCHTCGHHETVPSSCSVCKGADIVFKSAGTKALADWLQKHFRTARVARFDTDNLVAESLHERHEEVASGDIDILVGTQMLVKGLDLTHLSVVGIVAADLSLQIPDFSAEERTYQLIRQAIGRVGRGHTHGTTIIQTFNPDSKVILQAVNKNYDAFYTTQIEQRLAFQFSPLVFIAAFWCSKKTTVAALAEAQKSLTHLSKNTQNCTFLGPVITFHPKRRGMATAQIVVKSHNRKALNEIASLLPANWQYDLEPINLL